VRIAATQVSEPQSEASDVGGRESEFPSQNPPPSEPTQGPQVGNQMGITEVMQVMLEMQKELRGLKERLDTNPVHSQAAPPPPL
ncbi:hypothetical protein DVA76_19305, partial [Acinetobacter baumannii]